MSRLQCIGSPLKRLIIGSEVVFYDHKAKSTEGQIGVLKVPYHHIVLTFVRQETLFAPFDQTVYRKKTSLLRANKIVYFEKGGKTKSSSKKRQDLGYQSRGKNISPSLRIDL